MITCYVTFNRSLITFSDRQRADRREERDATTDKIDSTRKGEESDFKDNEKEEDIIAAPPILRELKSMTVTARKDYFTIDHNKIDDNTEDCPIENNIFPFKSSTEIPSQKELFHTNSAEDINECDESELLKNRTIQTLKIMDRRHVQLCRYFNIEKKDRSANLTDIISNPTFL